MKFPMKFATPAALALAAGVCILGAMGAASLIEARTSAAVRQALVVAGQDWAQVRPSGLQIILSGTAPSEARRFNALTAAGSIIDSTRLRDHIEVAAPEAVKAPAFSMEILRNDDGISLIGLAPATTDRAAMIKGLTALAGEGKVTDMLETADHRAPEGWTSALAYAMQVLKILPRAKVSVDAGHVAITAITNSPAEKAALEADLKRKAPSGLTLALQIDAPHPVIAPFTLRYLSDGTSGHFDACSADSDTARDRIVAAAVAAGAAGKPGCVIGLGVPTPQWADAVTLGIGTLHAMGPGTITFSDVDVSLVADPGVSQASFDTAVGALESNLPDVFSLHAVLTPAATAAAEQGPSEFSAALAPDGQVQLRGRLPDVTTRDAVDSYARARFGAADVYAATRVDANLPAGWPIRALTGIEALAELAEGMVTVQADRLTITGVSGAQDASDKIARILSSKLGEGANFAINVRYDAKRDPTAGLPTAEECVTQINAALAAHKITFEPGSATITHDAGDTLDKVAALMKNCSDFPMEIGGHTDSQGREEMNLSLSQDRAQAVITALQSRRVLTGHLTALGYGETVPVGDNSTETGREQNRRIEVRLLTVPAPDGTATGSGDAPAAPDAMAPADGTDAPQTSAPAAMSDGSIAVKTPDGATVRPLLRPAQPDVPADASPDAPADAPQDAPPASGGPDATD